MKLAKTTSQIKANNFFLHNIKNAISTNDIKACADLSHDLFSSKNASSELGKLGHEVDMLFQQTTSNSGLILLNEYSSNYPSVLPSSFVNKINSDPNCNNFSSSNQPFTMLTEALIAHALPTLYSHAIDDAELLMGRNIAHQFFPKFHTGQSSSDLCVYKKLSSGAQFEYVLDVKRSSLKVIDMRVRNYISNPKSLSKPIYSNVHITSDVSSNHSVSPHLYQFLKDQLQETKDFYILNRRFYTDSQFKAIEEAVNNSIDPENKFNKFGMLNDYNKILYNAAKFITSDQLCQLLKIPNLK